VQALTSRDDPRRAPVFGFLAFTGGSSEGAVIRDMRLANALWQRGFRVVVYWMMEARPELPDPDILQRILCSGLRYHGSRPSSSLDRIGRMSRLIPAPHRLGFVQEHPAYVSRLLQNCIRAMCEGDRLLGKRLLDFVARDGVTCLLPTFAWTASLAAYVKDRRPDTFDYLVTFQGEEIFANYAAAIGQLEAYKAMLRTVVQASGRPAIAVSQDYAARLSDEISLDPSQLVAIPPGIVLPAIHGPVDLAANKQTLSSTFPTLRGDRPIITYLGRQDAEKGIDLLLYAARILDERGVRFELVCTGPTSFGNHYSEACRMIADHLRLPVIWGEEISDEARTALFRLSHCVVCPSIHREPFGMVVAEAMSMGTPVVVPDAGGIGGIVRDGARRGGLTFKSWDTGDLADALERLLRDAGLYAELRSQARVLASRFSMERLADAVLAQLGLDPGASPADAKASR
jgi:glycosyltransferase involved in cell wall biosynthesis